MIQLSQLPTTLRHKWNHPFRATSTYHQQSTIDLFVHVLFCYFVREKRRKEKKGKGKGKGKEKKKGLRKSLDTINLVDLLPLRLLHRGPLPPQNPVA